MSISKLIPTLALIAWFGSGCAIYRSICSLEAPERTPPTVTAAANPASGLAPLKTELSAQGSDADGQVVGYAWDLGDGSSASGATVKHTYAMPGSYTARVTATDDDGLTASASTSVNAASQRAAPVVPSQRIVLRGVNFDFDKADIRPDARVILDEAISTLRENPGVNVEVAGHTDSVGTDEYNQGLSERRSTAIANDLAANGVNRSRLTVNGYGESRPVATNQTSDGRAQNRRVELNVR